MAVETTCCAVAPEFAAGASDFEVNPTFLENMYTPDVHILLTYSMEQSPS